MTLYELAHEMAAFDLKVDEETGEVTNMDELEALQMEHDAKVENIGLWVKNLKAESDAIKEEVKKLTARARVADNKAERLKEYLTECLAGEKFKTARLQVSYRKSQAVNITDTLALPEEFTVIDIKPDKTAIKTAIKMGNTIPGAELEERTSTIIK